MKLIRSDRGHAGPEADSISRPRSLKPSGDAFSNGRSSMISFNLARLGRPSRSLREAGTTLIEMLVVIVVFLVGILAIVQVFPKGFQILVWTRNESVATALARDQVEILKSRADQLPEAIIPGHYVKTSGGVDFISDANQSPNDLNLLGNGAGATVDSKGNFGLPIVLYANPNLPNNVPANDYTRYMGANRTRHIIGEARIIPAPRMVGSTSGYYGGTIVLNFGPIEFVQDPVNPLVNSVNVYGNDLTAHEGFPQVGDFHTDDEYFIANPQDATIALDLPEGPINLPNGNANQSTRIYTMSFSAYVTTGGSTVKRDFFGLNVTTPKAAPDANGVQPLFQVNLSTLVPGLGSVDLSTLRVRRVFQQVAVGSVWENYEPYTCELVNPSLGVVLFSPYAFGQTISGPTGRVPLQARIDYDVYDWSILREEFRFPQGQLAQHQLAVGSIKVDGNADFDNRTITPIPVLEMAGSQSFVANHNAADNFLLVDLDTGGVFMEKVGNDPNADVNSTLITVNKSTGLITVRDADGDPTNGTQANLLLPDGNVLQNVTIDNRALRALYVPRNNYQVQVLKAPAHYTESLAGVGFAQFAIGPNVGGAATRIYFPMADIGRKVTASVINYRRTGDASPRQLHDQDFVINAPSLLDPAHLPFIDISTVDPQASTLDVNIDSRSFGYAVSGVKGSSVAVRVLWNPNFFQLGSDGAANLNLITTYGQGWRKTTNETYLEKGDLVP